MEKYRARSILKPTLELVRISIAFLLRGCRVFFTVHVHAVIQLLPVHPDAFKSFFTVRLA